MRIKQETLRWKFKQKVGRLTISLPRRKMLTKSFRAASLQNDSGTAGQIVVAAMSLTLIANAAWSASETDQNILDPVVVSATRTEAH